MGILQAASGDAEWSGSRGGMTNEQAQEAFAQQKAVLSSATCRLDFGFAFSISGTLQCVSIMKEESYETRGGNWKTRWVRVGPVLMAPKDDNTRAGLLRQLAGIIETTTEPIIEQRDVEL